tara:strand:+ start:63 stop:332 length:270 start_codon:yes stop_codon:yes gene_type:complete
VHKLKINNSLDVARWEKLPCKCNHDSIELEYPIHKCEHCRCKEAWESVPKKYFKVNDFNDKGKIIGEKTIKEITLVRGHDLQDVIGWIY